MDAQALPIEMQYIARMAARFLPEARLKYESLVGRLLQVIRNCTSQASAVKALLSALDAEPFLDSEEGPLCVMAYTPNPEAFLEFNPELDWTREDWNGAAHAALIKEVVSLAPVFRRGCVLPWKSN